MSSISTPVDVRKVILSRAGGPEVVSVVDAKLDAPKPDETTIEVLYSGFSTTDINMRDGQYPFQRGFPLTPGYSVVGRVHALGSQNNNGGIRKGQLVTAMTVYDSEATFTNVPTKYLVPLPETLESDSVRDCAALAIDWLTAYGFITRSARKVLQLDVPEDRRTRKRIFIHGLSGAVGQALARLTRLFSPTAEVFGTASSRNREGLLQQGCKDVYDYRKKDWIEAVQDMGGMHVVFDPLGFESFDESYSILTNNEPSILIGYGANAGLYGGFRRSPIWAVVKLYLRNLVPGKRSTCFAYVDRDQKTYKSDLQSLIQLIEKKEIEVPVKKIISGLDGVPAAHKDWVGMEGMGSAFVKIGSL